MNKNETKLIIVPEKHLKIIRNNRMKTDAILAHLANVGIKMSGRQWRRFVRHYNDQYGSRERYIASDPNGYILTVKKDEIKRSNLNKIRVGIAMIRNGKAGLKELAEKNQLSLLDGEADIYDLAMKLKI